MFSYEETEGFMPQRQRRLGPHHRVHTVDLTGLNCNVKVFGTPDDNGTMPLIEGSWFAVGRVKEETASSDAGVKLVLTYGSSSAKARRTRKATASPSGSAASGVRRSTRTHMIQQNQPYRRNVPNSPVTVSLFVTHGTHVLY